MYKPILYNEGTYFIFYILISSKYVVETDLIL